VNQIKLACARGSLAARMRNTPRVAYTPMIICSYSDCLGVQAKPEGHTHIIIRGIPAMNARPKTTSATFKDASLLSWSMRDPFSLRQGCSHLLRP
jgi:hypothetical protein